jgi:hypothetical protein
MLHDIESVLQAQRTKFFLRQLPGATTPDLDEKLGHPFVHLPLLVVVSVHIGARCLHGLIVGMPRAV